MQDLGVSGVVHRMSFLEEVANKVDSDARQGEAICTERDVRKLSSWFFFPLHSTHFSKSINMSRDSLPKY